MAEVVEKESRDVATSVEAMGIGDVVLPPSTTIPATASTASTERTETMPPPPPRPASAAHQQHTKPELSKQGSNSRIKSVAGMGLPPPHSPLGTAGRNRQGIMHPSKPIHGIPAYGRPRSHSLGSAYSTTPLLVPQSPPPSVRIGGGAGRLRSTSLSPQFANSARSIDGMAISAGAAGGGAMMPSIPAFLNSAQPPRVPDVQKVVEAAIQTERQRTKDMEKDEVDLTADELRAILRKERHRMARFAGDIAKLRNLSVQSQAEAEIHEEGRINGLMRRLETLQIEKGRIIVELEREEEMLTNTLQKKLNQVRREKAQLERLIEHEQLSHSDLKSKLSGLQNQSAGAAAAADGGEVEENALGPPPVRLGHTPAMDSLAELPDEEDEEEDEDNDEDSNSESTPVPV